MVDIGIARWIIIGIIIVSLIVGAIFVVPRFNVTIVGADKECEFPRGVCDFGTMLGFPTGWLRSDTFIWYALLPLFGVTLVVYGFMTVINIFGRNRSGFYFLLSFVIAFSTVPMGYFVLFVSLAFSFIGSWSIIMFIILFVGGTIFLFISKTKTWRAGSYMKEAFNVERRSAEKDIDYGKKFLVDLDREAERIKKLPADQQPDALLRLEQRRKQAEQFVKGGQERLKIIGQQEKVYLKRLKELNK